MTNRVIKTVRGINIVQIAPVGAFGVGTEFLLEREDGSEVGRFTLLPAGKGQWMSLSDPKANSDQAMTTSYAESFVAEVNRGEIKLDGHR